MYHKYHTSLDLLRANALRSVILRSGLKLPAGEVSGDDRLRYEDCYSLIAYPVGYELVKRSTP